MSKTRQGMERQVKGLGSNHLRHLMTFMQNFLRRPNQSFLPPWRPNAEIRKCFIWVSGHALKLSIKDKKSLEMPCPDNASIHAESPYPYRRFVWVRDETSSVYFQCSPCNGRTDIILKKRGVHKRFPGIAKIFRITGHVHR